MLFSGDMSSTNRSICARISIGRLVLLVSYFGRLQWSGNLSIIFSVILVWKCSIRNVNCSFLYYVNMNCCFQTEVPLGTIFIMWMWTAVPFFIMWMWTAAPFFLLCECELLLLYLLLECELLLLSPIYTSSTSPSLQHLLSTVQRRFSSKTGY